MLSSPLFMGARRFHFDEIDSTNAWLQAAGRAEQYPEGTAVTTDFQVSGRGQQGATWEAEKGKNILVSILVKPSFLPLNRQFLLSMAVALAVQKTVQHFLPVQSVEIKWPNDIYVEERKVCGILIENSLSGEKINSSIIGIGLNVNQPFDEYQPRCSMANYAGRELNKDHVLQLLFGKLEQEYLHLRQGKYDDITEEYHAHLYRKGLIAEYWHAQDKRQFSAILEGVSPEGKLMLRLADGAVLSFLNKEVRFL